MTQRYKLNEGKPLSAEDLKLLEELKNKSDEEINFEDIPPISTEELIKAVKKRNQRLRKETVSLRLDQETIDIAKSFGKGYTTQMCQILQYVYRHPQLLAKCLL